MLTLENILLCTHGIYNHDLISGSITYLDCLQVTHLLVDLWRQLAADQTIIMESSVK